MRFLDRLISFVFSVIMLVLSIVIILVGVGVFSPSMILEALSTHVLNEDVIKTGLFNPITITGIVLLVLSLKTTVFLSFFKVRSRAPISVKTKNGEVQITQETIVSTAKNATLEFDNVKEVQVSMRKKARGVKINEIIQVYMNTNIRDLTEAIQESVKAIVNATTGVNVLDVNIRVKNVYKGSRKEEKVAVKLEPIKQPPIITEENKEAKEEPKKESEPAGDKIEDDSVAHLPEPEIVISKEENKKEEENK